MPAIIMPPLRNRRMSKSAVGRPVASSSARGGCAPASASRAAISPGGAFSACRLVGKRRRRVATRSANGAEFRRRPSASRSPGGTSAKMRPPASAKPRTAATSSSDRAMLCGSTRSRVPSRASSPAESASGMIQRGCAPRPAKARAARRVAARQGLSAVSASASRSTQASPPRRRSSSQVILKLACE